jgi:hypothetical protein
MITHRTLGENDIGTAWGFVEDCEDESPRAYGLKLALGRVIRDRDGVHRLRASSVAFSALSSRKVTDVEDALIARIDRARRRARAA